MKVFKYKIYCETDAKFEYVWLDETASVPTTCPVNAGHTVTQNSTSISEVVGPDIQTLKPFADANGFRARFKGVSGTMAAGTSTNLDHVLAEERWIDGIEVHQIGAAAGDNLMFQIVHPQAGVLDEFGSNWFIDSSTGKQNPVIVSYPAKIPAGLTIRTVYNSVGGSSVWLGVNLRLHKKT